MMFGGITGNWIWAFMRDAFALDTSQTTFARVMDVHAVVEEVFFAYLKSKWLDQQFWMVTKFAGALDVEVD